MGGYGAPGDRPGHQASPLLRLSRGRNAGYFSASLATDWAQGAILFVATAGVVLWQNFRLGILWDLSYILETSYRISWGDVPYRDFPIPFAPLTFLTQAALIKFGGRNYFHHVMYAALAGGIATVLAWRILLYLLNEEIAYARLIAFLLTLPLVPLGIYSVFPHPFYDCDCTLTILLAIFLLLRLERKDFPPLRSLLTGTVVAIPMFVKQNAGLAFLAGSIACLAFLGVVARNDRKRTTGYSLTIVGAAFAFALALILIHMSAGIRNYWHWTIQFAAARRLPPLHELLAVYEDPQLLWRIGSFASGALLLALNNRKAKPAFTRLTIFLLSLPFVWTVIALAAEDNPSDRVDQLLALWPFLIVISLVSALWNFRNRARSEPYTFGDVLPFILIATINGAFLSQQVWGSTYAIWPLFMVLCACTLSIIYSAHASSVSRSAAIDAGIPAALLTAALVSASLIVFGGYYVWSAERLSYAKLFEGNMARSSLPQLAGLSVRGPWIPEFERLVRFTKQEVPMEDGLLIIPGEDLFYYTTGRRPRFPVLMFDHTLNPYSPEEIKELARSRNIRWLIVKNELQVNGEPVEDKGVLLAALREDFELVKSVGIYDVYRRPDSQ